MAIELNIDNKSIAELRAELIKLKGDLASATDPETVKQLAQAAGQVQDKLKDVNEQVQIFAAGSQFEVAKNALGGVGDALKNLDFAKANERATALATAVKGMSFSGATESLKNLGSTFLQLGKALLTNPIFLLAAVLTAITIAVIKLLDSLGLLKPIMDAIKKAIDFVIEAFQSLTDWLGLTEHATTKYAQATIEAGEKAQQAAEKDAKAKKELYDITKNLTEEEIALLEEKLGVQIDTSKSIFDINQEQLDLIKETTQASIDALEQKKNLTEEEKKQLDALKKKYEENNAAIVTNENNKAKAILDLNRNLDKQLSQLLVDNIKDEQDRSKAVIKLRLQESLDKIDIQIREAKQLGQDTTKLEQIRVETVKAAENQISDIERKANEDAQKRRKELADKAKADREKAANEALQLIQNQNKLELALLEEGTVQRLEATKAAAEEEKQFLIENAKTLGLITKQGDDSVLQLRLLALDEYVNKEQEAFNKSQELRIQKEQKANQEREASVLNISKTIADTEASRLKFDIDNVKLATEQKIALLFQYKDALLNSIEAEKQARLNAVQDEIEALNKVPSDETSAERDARLLKIREFETQKAALEEEFRQAKVVAEQTVEGQISEIRNQTLQQSIQQVGEYLAGAQQLSAGFASIFDSIFEIQNQDREARNQAELSGLEEGSEAYKKAKEKQLIEDDKAARKQFEIGKALQLANAVVQGTQAVLAAYSSGVATPIVGPATGTIFAGIAAAVAAANIAKIAATKYKGPASASTSGIGTAAGGGGGNIVPATNVVNGGGPATPNISFFGQGNNQNTTNATPTTIVPEQNITVTATISETEVTSTQQRVARIRQSAEL